jgi:hypothetical protein
MQSSLIKELPSRHIAKRKVGSCYNMLMLFYFFILRYALSISEEEIKTLEDDIVSGVVKPVIFNCLTLFLQ